MLHNDEDVRKVVLLLAVRDEHVDQFRDVAAGSIFRRFMDLAKHLYFSYHLDTVIVILSKALNEFNGHVHARDSALAVYDLAEAALSSSFDELILSSRSHPLFGELEVIQAFLQLNQNRIGSLRFGERRLRYGGGVGSWRDERFRFRWRNLSFHRLVPG